MTGEVVPRTCGRCGLYPSEEDIRRLVARVNSRCCDICQKPYVVRRIEIFHDCGKSIGGEPYATWHAYVPPEDDDQLVEIRLVPRRPMRIYGLYGHAHLDCVRQLLPRMQPHSFPSASGYTD